MVRLALALIILAGAVNAAPCRLALVLAIDISSSVDANEDALQRGGLAAALQATEVQQAFLSGNQPVALSVFEWSGRYNQELLLDWTMIENPADLILVANTISGSRRSHNEFATAMGHALGYAAELLQAGPDCLARTIDLAGDGVNNDGFGPEEAYRHFAFDNVTVNGLVVNAADFEGELNLIDFFLTEVIRGPGAFIEIAQGFADYEVAMRRKLMRELGAFAIGALE